MVDKMGGVDEADHPGRAVHERFLLFPLGNL
jgi:hypothetical protein